MGYTTSGVLAAVAGVHVAWGIGSAFPFRTRAELADAVVGSENVPPPTACYAVAAALTTASLLVADVAILPARTRRLGRFVIAVVLTIRGVAGLAGRTDALSPGSSSPRFRRLDRRVYTPLCLALTAGAVITTSGR